MLKSVFSGAEFWVAVVLSRGRGNPPPAESPLPHFSTPFPSNPFPSFSFPCLGLSWPVLARFSFPTWPQLGSQNPPKSIKNRCQDAFPSWFHFGIDFSSIFTSKFDPLNPQNHNCSLGKTRFFQKIAFRSWHRFLFDFSANMPPFFLQKSTKIYPKTDLERHRFFDRFWHRF